MKKLLVLTALVVSISINAEIKTGTKDLACDSIDAVISELNGVNEKPIMMGKTNTGSIMVSTLNAKTSTWTIIEIKDKLACVLATGDSAGVNKDFFSAETYMNNVILKRQVL